MLNFFRNTNNRQYVNIQALPIVGFESPGVVFTYDAGKKRATLPNGKIIYNIVLDKNYFKEVMHVFSEGETVLFNDTLFVVDAVNIAEGRYTLYNDNDDITKYNVKEELIRKVKVYWFTNSEGIICRTYVGKNRSADQWRSVSDNMFASKEDAQTKYRSIAIQRK